MELKDTMTVSPTESLATPLEELQAKPLILGLFLPFQQGAWSPSKWPRGTDWTFAYNARLAMRAEEVGFDLLFGLAQWLGKGGYGGETSFREHTQDPLIMTAGLAPITKRIILIGTAHILYAWHPLHIAKYGACIDEMSGGRWGINIVTGYKTSEYRMFGMEPIEHEQRYDMADEFTSILARLWSEDENLTIHGKYWSLENAFVSPKPIHRPIMVNAASSDAGLRYAAKHSDLIFITSPGGADPYRAVETLPARTEHIARLAANHGRRVSTIINPHVICRETEKEAKAAYNAILANEDSVAADNFVSEFTGGDQASWRGHSRANWVVGGNVHLVGTPEQIVEWFIKLKDAGCDGVQINFYDYVPDLDYFGAEVLPLMHQAGLR